MTVLVYSAVFGGRDYPHPQVEQEGVDVDWAFFTDDPTLDVPEPWDREGASAHHPHPNMAAKWYKTRPPVRPSGAEYDAAIWLDASMELTNPRAVVEMVAALDGAPIAAFAHPRRLDVYEEAVASLGPEGLGRYDALPIVEQMDAYREEGYPPGSGLWCGGAIVWASTTESRLLGKAWGNECDRWGFQDQLALPVVCWRRGYRPSTFPVPLIERQVRGRIENRWLTLHPHRPGSEHPAV